MATASSSLTTPGFDIEDVLAPVSEDNPVGEDLRRLSVDGKSMLMAVIEEKRRAIIGGANENLDPEEKLDPATLAQQRKGEWLDVEMMLIKAFAKGKELGAAVSFSQAAMMSHGWAAVGPALRFVRLIQERFEDTLFPVPEADENGKLDFVPRLVLLERLDHENCIPLAVRQLPITDSRSGSEFSWADYRQLEILKQTPPGKEEDPEERRRMLAERARAFDDAVSKSSLSYYEMLFKTMQDGAAELASLRAFVEQHYAGSFDEYQPTFRRTEEALEDCQTLTRQILNKKGGGPGFDASGIGCDAVR
jgi:ImpA, N-terminal, type VI secretion system